MRCLTDAYAKKSKISLGVVLQAPLDMSFKVHIVQNFNTDAGAQQITLDMYTSISAPINVF